MITAKDFYQENTDFSNWRSRLRSNFLIIGATLDQILDAIGSLVSPTFNPAERVVNGYERPYRSRAYDFDILTSDPDMVYDITRYIHKKYRTNVVGYANGGYEAHEFIATKNGDPYDGFTAKRTYYMNLGEAKDEELLWSYHFDVEDTDTGLVFHAGAGTVRNDEKEMYEYIVKNHQKVVSENKPGIKEV